jgi:hypothetical protein
MAGIFKSFVNDGQPMTLNKEWLIAAGFDILIMLYL